MQITEIHVEYRRQISDGNYGNETVSIAYTATVEDGETASGVTAALTEQAREWATQRLKESRSDTVRWALETPDERTAREEREREERLARERAEWEAQTAAGSHTHAVGQPLDVGDSPF